VALDEVWVRSSPLMLEQNKASTAFDKLLVANTALGVYAQSGFTRLERISAAASWLGTWLIHWVSAAASWLGTWLIHWVSSIDSVSFRAPASSFRWPSSARGTINQVQPRRNISSDRVP
jgi:hypothetical protein